MAYPFAACCSKIAEAAGLALALQELYGYLLAAEAWLSVH